MRNCFSEIFLLSIAALRMLDVKTWDLIDLSGPSLLIGVNRGIFGVSSQKKAEIEDLLESLEAVNPSPRPAENLDTVYYFFISESPASIV